LVSLRSVQGRIERERQLGQENVEREIEARDQEIEEREKIQKELGTTFFLFYRLKNNADKEGRD